MNLEGNCNFGHLRKQLLCEKDYLTMRKKYEKYCLSIHGIETLSKRLRINSRMEAPFLHVKEHILNIHVKHDF